MQKEAFLKKCPFGKFKDMIYLFFGKFEDMIYLPPKTQKIGLFPRNVQGYDLPPFWKFKDMIYLCFSNLLVYIFFSFIPFVISLSLSVLLLFFFFLFFLLLSSVLSFSFSYFSLLLCFFDFEAEEGREIMKK